MRTIFLFVYLAILSGCAVDIAKKSDGTVCTDAYFVGGIGLIDGKKAIAEAERRNLLRPGDKELIEQRKVRAGMSECAVLASIYVPKGVSSYNYRLGEKVTLTYVDEHTTVAGIIKRTEVVPRYELLVADNLVHYCNRFEPVQSTGNRTQYRRIPCE